MKSKRALRQLKRRLFCNTEQEYCENIHYCEIIEKDLKALEIIKKRQIDVQDITDITDDYYLYVAYCEGNAYADEYICSRDEFKLLREVLTDDK